MALNGFKIACLGMVLIFIVSAYSVFADEPDPTFLSGCSLSNSQQQDRAWCETEKSEGVTNFTKTIQGSDLNAYKGVCIIDSPIEIIYDILSNVSEHSKWIKYCATSRELDRPSDKQSFQYYDFDVPWPLANRDIVVHCTTEADWGRGKITIQSEAVKEPLVPIRKNHMRITDSRQEWILEQVTPDSTRVTFVSYTNMEGPVSKMLNKLISKVIPSSSLKNLKKISMEKYLSASDRFIAKTYP
ncbi:MAG: hypothetical protein KKD44_13350 [Proteobacteria bacterium]|nr:hypothetical protein [Pseudomonadota bacterium]